MEGDRDGIGGINCECGLRQAGQHHDQSQNNHGDAPDEMRRVFHEVPPFFQKVFITVNFIIIHSTIEIKQKGISVKKGCCKKNMERPVCIWHKNPLQKRIPFHTRNGVPFKKKKPLKNQGFFHAAGGS